MAKKERTCSDCAHLDTATLTCGIGMDMAASRCWMFRQIEEAPIVSVTWERMIGREVVSDG